jgi:hypothetical protein
MAPAANAEATTQITGSTRLGDTWARSVDGSSEPASHRDATPYQVVVVRPTQSGTHHVALRSDGDRFRPALCLYDGVFDPQSPDQHRIACNETVFADDEAGLDAQLVAGSTYIAVATGVGDEDYGDYALTVQGPAAITMQLRSPMGGVVPTSGRDIDRPLEGTAPLRAGTRSGFYDIVGFAVSRAGAYSFDIGGSEDAFACLYSQSFDDSSPTEGGIVCADVGGTTPRAAYFTATLAAQTRYVLMVTGSEPGQHGAWQAAVDGPGSVTLGQMSGDLAGKATWTRPTQATPPAQGTQRARYEARPFQVTSTGTYAIHLGEGDQYLCVYRAPFDPLSPTVNALACNDDGGDNQVSSARMVDLTAGTPYVLVASSWNLGTGVGPWIAEFAGPADVVVEPSVPTVRGVYAYDWANTLSVSLAPGRTGSAPTSYTATLYPYLGTTPGTTFTSAEPSFEVPLPSGSAQGDRFSLVVRANTAAGSSPTRQIDPPPTPEIESVTPDDPFSLEVAVDPGAVGPPYDNLVVQALPRSAPADTFRYRSAIYDAERGLVRFRGLTPDTDYDISVGRESGLGSSTAVTSLVRTASATALPQMTVTADGPTVVRPLPSADGVFGSSAVTVRSQTAYFRVSEAGSYQFLASGTTYWDSHLVVARSGFTGSALADSTVGLVDDTARADNGMGLQALAVQLQPGDYAIVLSGWSGTSVGSSRLFVRAPSGSHLEVAPPGAPRAPTAPTVADAGPGAVSVVVPPAADIQDAPTGYDVTLRAADGSIEHGQLPASGTGTVEGLVDGTSYDVTVRARNASGQGLASAPSVVALPTVPAAPAAPVVDEITATTARVVVAEPDGRGLPVTGYTAVVRPGNHSVTTDGVGPIPLDGLSRGTTYTVAVTARNARGAGTQSTETAFTTAGLPAAPEISDVVPGVHSATFTIHPPDDAGSPITSYGVRLVPVAGSAPTVSVDPRPTQAGPITVNGLRSATAYRIEVVARNEVGDGTTSAPIEVTPISQVTGAPTTTGAHVVSDGSARVEFEPPSEPGTDSVSSYVATVNPGGRQLVLPAEARTVEVDGLEPNTAYTVTVVARSDAGDSAPSSMQAFTTFGPPGRPVVRSSIPEIGAVRISVDAPASNGSSITHYLVSATPEGAAGPAVVVESAATSAVVTGLRGDVRYSIDVAAINRYGTGQAVRTLATPLAPVPPRPQVVGSSSRSGAMTVTLAAPAAAGVTIQATVTPTGGGTVVNGTVDGGIISFQGLTNGIRYRATVTQASSGGVSPQTSVERVVGVPTLRLTQTARRPKVRVRAVFAIGGTPIAHQPVRLESAGRLIRTGRTDSHGRVAWTVPAKAGPRVRAVATVEDRRVRSRTIRLRR